ncbi:beta-ketoacyl-ACP synthase III [Aneurinibacillus aneurinilyticus]|uniref:Beta-ketoacyl-[acyl-carrier-protein] synthase III n=1 Tax=Aneurinibacillus aneurinilyticus TaxID=1391 RepID=A0A848D574_ANEAE|nr:beta-ketoacyl-ACP synthase III [Aneurinibacillus aneurinilyticus]MED0709266.1 ketoacyl-ACP synthase III [Aneurinibacillus aneurinilyticus]MED0724896.1 ketoacyl-ACP synthase III [Aneurinibacillus aneurinilyticus]MED0732489.1 ketoacyl-ACP synthase III [Aneurinibacillus aneurinilyticus]MED0744077.1 ketoacyl-ACP synthase III [Aneurinibacillus aneurinilyticus]NMF00821.1 ketoacyl-ACP synthase III [Aneurinibacillus aneurinilyticus]
MRVGVLGLGVHVPAKIVTNSDLAEMMDTSDEWIRTRTGIEKRHIASKDERTSDMATIAAEKAIKDAGLTVEDIDLILVATATPDYMFPSTACLVQDKLGARNIGAMDISAACSGFIYGMITAKQFIETGAYRHVLVIGAEKFSEIVDWADRNTAVLFGDGAGAVVLGPVSEHKGIRSFELGADGSGGQHLRTDKKVKMNGREVYKFAVRQVPKTILHVIEQANVTIDDIHMIVPHQANIRIIKAAQEKLGIEDQRISVTVDRYSNTSAASIPLSLHHEVTTRRINDGDTLVLAGFGGGLTWASLVIRWGK